MAVVASTCLVAAAGGWTGAAPLGDGVGRLLAAGAGVAVLGLVADVWRLSNRILLVGTAVAAAFVVPYDETGLPAGLAAVAWIACVAAAFRGLDHADGLAGTVGVLTAFGAGACAAAEMMDDLAVLLSILAAALTGFLMHNWHPARIAFGACGSLFTGFVLAASAVLVTHGVRRRPHRRRALSGLTALASAERGGSGVLVPAAGPGGPLQGGGGPRPLREPGAPARLTPPGATVLLGVAAFATVLGGVLVHTGWLAPTGALWAAGAVLAAVLALLRVRVYGPRRPGGRPGTATHRHTTFGRHTTLGRPTGSQRDPRAARDTGAHRTAGTGFPAPSAAPTPTSNRSSTRMSPFEAYGGRGRAGDETPAKGRRAPGGTGALGAPRGPGADARGMRVPPASRGQAPAPPPQQSASSQLRESLRVRDG
ncbi:glycosyltransferase [Streptomyces sp. e14]|nr:glycosyltransferase [Streptomyces sp. e14]